MKVKGNYNNKINDINVKYGLGDINREVYNATIEEGIYRTPVVNNALSVLVEIRRLQEIYKQKRTTKL